MNKTFLYQINVTRDCNIRCTHCYISSDKKAASKTMSIDQVLDIFKQIRDHMQVDKDTINQYDTAEIHIIGGEPTMLGLPYYQELMPQVREIIKEIPKNVSLRIVSNLVANDSVEIVSMFDDVSTSYEVETRFTKDKLHNRWEQNVKVLSLNPDINLSITGSITKPTINHGASQLMEYFVSLGLLKVHMGFFIPSGDGLINQNSVFPAFEQTSQYLIDLTDWYIEHREKYKGLAVNPVESLIHSIYNNVPSDDIVCPIIPGSLDFDWNGDTVTCIEKGGELEVDWISNVFEVPITSIVDSEKYIRERVSCSSPKGVCRRCDEYAVCRSACSVLHGVWDGEGECPGFKKWIKHTRKLVENGLLPLSENYKNGVAA